MTIDLEKTFKACGLNIVDEHLAKDLKNIIEWQDVLQQVNVDSIEPLYSTIGDDEQYITNNDIVKMNDYDNIENILANSKDKNDSFFLVPKVIK